MNSTAGAAYSLKRRLLLALLGGVASVWIATAIFSYFDARQEINQLLDAHLAQSAYLIVAQVGHDLEEIDMEDAPRFVDRNRRVAFQIWERGRNLRLHSANAPGARLSPSEEGFSAVLIDGRGWRVFSAWDSRRRYLVQVGERDEARGTIAADFTSNLLVPLLLALPVLGLFAWFTIARALRPLSAIGRQVEERKPDNLEALQVDDAPAEVAPLVRSLNALFGRVSLLIEGERRFTADAAHELRTPLAALKTQAQVALGAVDDGERRRALDNVITGCDRAARLLEQLLTLARLEPDMLAGKAEPCELRTLAAQIIAELAPAAVSRKIEIEFAAGKEAPIHGYPGLISILLRNLVDNAIRYCTAGGSVHVNVTVEGDSATVSVTDEGRGIAPEERSKVGQRFYRILGTDESGSGLGLSIVRRIAEIHGATVTFSDGPDKRGLRVTVVFARKQS